MNTIRSVLKDAELLVQKLREADNILTRLGSNGLGIESPNQLTKKEDEVYRLIAEGNDMEQIASKLQISRKTVDVHRDRIKKKLGYASSKDLHKALKRQ